MTRRFEMTIDGHSAVPDAYHPILNPSTGAVVGLCPTGTVEHLEKAVDAAERAYASWRRSSDAQRQSACQAIAKVVSDNARELSVLLTEEQGKPLKGMGSEFELGGCAAWAGYTASLSFTGSIATGKKVMASASPTLKPLTLELGGNDAGIVLPDADMGRLAESMFWGAFINSDQTCGALKRLYVHDSIHDKVCRSLVDYGRNIPMGDGLDDAIARANGTDFGLDASVWGTDKTKTAEVAARLDAGTVIINKHAEIAPNVPFGGIKCSGIGVEFGQEGLEAYTTIKIINAAA